MAAHQYHPCDQYSEQWSKLRIGIPTASGFHNIITPTGIPTRGATRLKYKYRLVAERLLQQCMDDHHESYWMRRGSELEDEAVKALSFHVQRIASVHKVGFFTALNGKVGASPDGVIVDRDTREIVFKEGVEIKCPAPYTQVGYLVDGPGDDYKAQVQGQLFVCQWRAMHFWSWHPSMPPYYALIHRNEAFVVKLVEALEAFCAEVDEAEAHCRGLGSYRLAEKLRLSDEMRMETVGDIIEGLMGQA